MENNNIYLDFIRQLSENGSATDTNEQKKDTEQQTNTNNQADAPAVTEVRDDMDKAFDNTNAFEQYVQELQNRTKYNDASNEKLLGVVSDVAKGNKPYYHLSMQGQQDAYEAQKELNKRLASGDISYDVQPKKEVTKNKSGYYLYDPEKDDNEFLNLNDQQLSSKMKEVNSKLESMNGKEADYAATFKIAEMLNDAITYRNEGHKANDPALRAAIEKENKQRQAQQKLQQQKAIESTDSYKLNLWIKQHLSENDENDTIYNSTGYNLGAQATYGKSQQEAIAIAYAYIQGDTSLADKKNFVRGALNGYKQDDNQLIPRYLGENMLRANIKNAKTEEEKSDSTKVYDEYVKVVQAESPGKRNSYIDKAENEALAKFVASYKKASAENAKLAEDNYDNSFGFLRDEDDIEMANLKRASQYLTGVDIAGLIRQAWDIMDPNTMRAYAVRVAESRGEMTNQGLQKAQNEIVDVFFKDCVKYVKEDIPEGAFGVIQNAFANSIAGNLFQGAIRWANGNNNELTLLDVYQQGLQEQDKNWAKNGWSGAANLITSKAFQMGFDTPFFGGIGGVASTATKPLLKPFVSLAVGKWVPKAVYNSAFNAFASTGGGRLLVGVTSGAITGALFNPISMAAQSYATGQSASVGDYLSGAAKGAFDFGAMAFTPIIGNYITKYNNKLFSGTGKWQTIGRTTGNVVVQDLISPGLNAAIVTGLENWREIVKHGISPDLATEYARTFGEFLGMHLGGKVSHLGNGKLINNLKAMYGYKTALQQQGFTKSELEAINNSEAVGKIKSIITESASIGEAEMKQISELHKEIIADNTIPEGAKLKLFAIVGDSAIATPTITNVERVEEGGKHVVKVYTAEGKLFSANEFSSKRQADNEVLRIRNIIEKNKIFATQSIFDAIWFQQVTNDATRTLAESRGVDVAEMSKQLNDIAERSKSGAELSSEDKALKKEFDGAIKNAVNNTTLQNSEQLKNSYNTVGVSIDSILSKDYSQWTKSDKELVSRYVDTMNNAIAKDNERKEAMIRRREVASIIKQSFDEGNSLEDAQSINETALRVNALENSIGNHLTDELRSEILNDPVSAYERVVNDENLSAPVKERILEYITTRAKFDGFVSSVNDRIDSEVEASNTAIDAITHKSEGNVIEVELTDNAGVEKGKKVYVINGKLSTYGDSMVDYDKSDKTIAIIVEGDEKPRMIYPSKIVRVVSNNSADELKNSARDEIVARISAESDNAVNGTINSVAVGDKISITNDEGNVVEAEVVQPTDQKGNPIAPKDGEVFIKVGEDIFPISLEQLSIRAGNAKYNTLLNEYRIEAEPKREAEIEDAEVNAETAENVSPEANKTPETDSIPQQEYKPGQFTLNENGEEKLAIVTGNVDEQGRIQYLVQGENEFRYATKDEMRKIAKDYKPYEDAEAEGDTMPEADAKDVDNAEQREADNEAEVVEQKVADEFPVDENGKKDYVSAGAERTAKHIYDELGLEKENADELVENNIASATEELANAEKAKEESLKGVTDPDEMASLQKSANEAVNKAKQKKELWEGVKAERAKEKAENNVTPSLLDAVRTLYSKGKEVASKLFQRSFFDVAQTPKFMNELGLRGDKFTIKYGVIARHLGKDGSHALSEKDWEQLPQALQEPFAISRLTDKDDSYRIYTTLLTDGGEFVVVGADVKNAGREIEVNAISTVFGRRNNANLSKNEEVIYRSEEITPEQSSLLERPNFAQYPTEQELYGNKGSESSADLQEVDDKLRKLNDEYAEANKGWRNPDFHPNKEYWDNERRINAEIEGELKKLGDDDLSEIAKNLGGQVFYIGKRILYRRKVDALQKLSDEELQEIVDKKGELWGEAGDILEERNALKLNIQKHKELIDEQGEISGNAKKNYSLNKYIDKKGRPQLRGVYHKDGYAIATDTHVLVADKRKYDKENDGKIIDKDGNEIELGYPNAFAVVPRRIISSDIDAIDLLNFIAGVKNVVKSKKEKLKDKVILFNVGGELWAGSVENLEKFANAAVSLGGKIYFHNSEGGRIGLDSIYTESDKGFALMMPIDFTRDSIDKENYFAYKPSEMGAETDSMVGKEKHQFGEGGELRMVQELTEKSRNDMQTVARSLGVDLVFDDTLKENGRYTTIDKSTGRPTIHVAMNASNPLESVFGHEATHRVKSLDDGSYSELHDVARLMIGDEEFFDRANRKKELYAKNGITLSDADAREEVVSDYIGSLIYDKEHMGKLADRLSKPILSKIRDVVSDLLDYFRQNKMTADERLAKGSLRAIDRAFARASNSVQNDAEGTKYSIVEDKSEIDRLNKEELEIGYQNIELKDDLSVGSPMASKLKSKGKGRVATGNSQFGQWGRSEENPDLVDENGKIDLVKPDGKTVDKVDYNPYFHIRPYLFNKQFKQAWERPKLVFIETQFPNSELSSGFKADKAKLSVGRHNWNGGELILSRWTKPKAIVPWREVAPHWIEEFKDSGVYFDIVPPALLNTLRDNGVKILPPHKGMGKNCFEAYEAFKKGDYNPEYITDEQIDAFNERINSENRQSKYSIREDAREIDEAFQNQSVEEVNRKFNEDLERFENDELPVGSRLELGMPSNELRSSGFPDLPISMRASLLKRKAGMERHPFMASELKGLVNAIQKPIAVFHYSKENMRNLIANVTHGDKHFLVGVTLNYKSNGIEINSVSGLFPKESAEWIKWIQDGKAIRIDQKDKVLSLIDSLRTNPAESKRIGLDLDSVANVVENFENPTIESKKSALSSKSDKFSVRANDELEKKSLVGIHNLTDNNLRYAIKLGGLANPSTAVVDTDIMGLEGFGDISMIMPKSLVDKRTGKNVGTYAGDAYTPRFPKGDIVKHISSKGVEKINQDYQGNDQFSRDFREALRSYGSEYGGITPTLYYLYKLENGGADVVKHEGPKIKSESHRMMIDKYGEKEWSELSDADKQELVEYRRKEIKESLKDVEKSKADKFVNDLINSSDFNTLAYKKFRSLKMDYNMQKNAGDVDYQGTYNKAQNDVAMSGEYDKFTKWLDEKSIRYEIEDRIFRGYTPSGNRKYAPLTLSNISKVMKESGRAGSEAMMSGSPHSLRGKMLPLYKTLESIKKNKGILSDKETYERIRGEIENEYNELISIIRDIKGVDYNDAYYILEDALLRGFNYAEREAGITIDSETKERISAFGELLKESPVKYFETKFERPVMLNEFVAAVVPKDIDAELKNSLIDNGIAIEEYERGNEESRLEAVKRASNREDVKFSIREGVSEREAELRDAFMRKNPEDWKNVVELMKDTAIWEDVKNRYQELETDNEIADEVLALYSGSRGAERLRAEQEKLISAGASPLEKATAVSAIARVKDALNRFWRGVANFLGIRYTNAEQVADKVLSDLLNGVNPNSKIPVTKYQIIGEKGAEALDKAQEATIRMDNLSVAREMEKAGKDAKTIRLATGWERGADGKWRYEIMDGKFDRKGELHPERFELSSDDKKFLKDIFKEELEAFNKGVEVYKGKINNDADMVELYVAGGLERSKAERLMQIDAKKRKLDEYKKKKKLDDYLDNDELFKAYPKLRYVNVYLGDGNIALSGKLGSYKPEQNEIELYDISMDTLLHEVQHAIQHIEGFAKGGSKNEINKLFNDAYSELKARRWAEDLMRTAKEHEGEYQSQIEIEDILEKDYHDEDLSELIPSRKIREKGFNYFVRGYYDSALDDTIKQFKLDSNGGVNFDSYKGYKGLAGEVESRNVEARMNMSDQERREKLLADTEDVARKDQIFLFENGLALRENDFVEDTKYSIRDDGSMIEGAEEAKPATLRSILNDRNIGLKEQITLSKALLAEQNKSDKTLRKDFVRSLTDNLSDVRKAMSAQKVYDQATVKRVADLARIMLSTGHLSNLGKGEQQRLLSAIKNSAGANNNDESVQKIMDIMVSNQLKNGELALRELESKKGTRVDSSRVQHVGELDPSGNIMLDAFKKCRRMSDEKLSEQIGEYLDKMDSSDEAIADNASNAYAGAMIAKLYHEKIRTSIEDEQTLQYSLDDVSSNKELKKNNPEAYRQLVNSINDAITQNRIDRAQAYYDLVGMLTNKMKDSEENAKQFKEAEKQRVKNIHHIANSDMQGRKLRGDRKDNTLEGINNFPVFRFLASPLANLDQMLRMLGGKNSYGRGYLWNHFMRGWADSSDKEQVATEKYYDMLDKKASEIFGEKGYVFNGNTIKRAYRYTDLYSYAEDLPKATISYLDGGEMREYSLSQAELLYLYAVEKMPLGRATNRKMGISEEVMEQITNVLDEKLKRFADWTQEELLPSLGNEMNAVHRRMFGANMDSIENYFPFVRDKKAIKVEVENGNLKNFNDKISVKTGAIKKRTANVIKWDMPNCNFFKVLAKHVDEGCHWMGFAEINKDFSTLLSYNRFKQQVMNINSVYGNGEALWKTFSNVCAIATDAYEPQRSESDELMVRIAKNVTLSKIAFNPMPAIKQLLSLPAFFGEIKPQYIMQSLLRGGVADVKWAWDNLPNYRKRVKSRMIGDYYLRDSEFEKKGGIVGLLQTAGDKFESLAKKGMIANIGIDAWTIAVGAYGVYRSAKDKYIRWGMSEEKAEERAKQDATLCYNKSQQSSEGPFMSIVQIDHTFFSTMMMLFRNAATSYTRETHASLRNLKRLVSGEVDYEYMAKQILRQAEIPTFSKLFDSELNRQAEGTLANDHDYSLGTPGGKLQSAGIEDKPINLFPELISAVAEQNGLDIKYFSGLVDAINNPVAVFNEDGQTRIVVETDGGNDHCIIDIQPNEEGYRVTNIEPLSNHPNGYKIVAESLLDFTAPRYINQGKSKRMLKMSGVLSEFNKEDAKAISNIANNFVNPIVPEQQNFSVWRKEDIHKAKQQAKREIVGSTAKNIVNTAIFGLVLPWAWRIGGAASLLLLSDDDDAKQEVIDDANRKVVTSGLEGIAYGDVATDGLHVLWDRFVNGNKDAKLSYLGRNNPFYSDMSTMLQHMDRDVMQGCADIINIFISSMTGVNPQLVSNWTAAWMDKASGNRELSNEWGLFAARLVNTPKSQLENIYFEEVGLMGSEVSNYTPEQLAMRFANYQVRRGYSIIPSSCVGDSAFTKQKNYAFKIIKEKMNNSIDKDTQQKYEQFSASINEGKKKVGEAKNKYINGVIDGAQLFASLQYSKDYDIYRKYAKYDAELTKVVNLYLNCESTKEAKFLINSIRDIRRNLVESYDATLSGDAYKENASATKLDESVSKFWDDYYEMNPKALEKEQRKREVNKALSKQ